MRDVEKMISEDNLNKKVDVKGFTKQDSVVLKGIACILLMCIHSFGGTVARFEGYTIDYFPFSQDFFFDFCSFCKISVSIFAFISGYGLYLSAKKQCLDSKSTNVWLTNRFFKTFSGFWVFLLFLQ